MTYWKITTAPETEPKNQLGALIARILHPGYKRIEYVMTNLQGEIEQKLGNLYGFRNWIEYAFKQAKNEHEKGQIFVSLIILKFKNGGGCAYLMVRCLAQNREPTAPPEEKPESDVEPPVFSKHKWWDFQKGWKSTLNNLRLIIQPYVFFNLIKPWLLVFELSSLRFGFMKLIEIMNQFWGYVPVSSG